MNSIFSQAWLNRDESIEHFGFRAFDPSTAQRNETNFDRVSRIPVLVLLLLASKLVFAHGSVNANNADSSRAIQFPDTEKYLTLTVDLHTHSVFSDGHV